MRSCGSITSCKEINFTTKFKPQHKMKWNNCKIPIIFHRIANPLEVFSKVLLPLRFIAIQFIRMLFRWWFEYCSPLLYDSNDTVEKLYGLKPKLWKCWLTCCLICWVIFITHGDCCCWWNVSQSKALILNIFVLYFVNREELWTDRHRHCRHRRRRRRRQKTHD